MKRHCRVRPPYDKTFPKTNRIKNKKTNRIESKRTAAKTTVSTFFHFERKAMTNGQTKWNRKYKINKWDLEQSMVRFCFSLFHAIINERTKKHSYAIMRDVIRSIKMTKIQNIRKKVKKNYISQSIQIQNPTKLKTINDQRKFLSSYFFFFFFFWSFHFVRFNHPFQWAMAQYGGRCVLYDSVDLLDENKHITCAVRTQIYQIKI